MGICRFIGVALMGIGSGLHADLPILGQPLLPGLILVTNFHR